jgi:hypothetical protein
MSDNKEYVQFRQFTLNKQRICYLHIILLHVTNKQYWLIGARKNDRGHLKIGKK